MKKKRDYFYPTYQREFLEKEASVVSVIKRRDVGSIENTLAKRI